MPEGWGAQEEVPKQPGRGLKRWSKRQVLMDVYKETGDSLRGHSAKKTQGELTVMVT